MLVASISAFVAGIYLGTLQTFTIPHAGIFLCFSLTLLPFLFRFNLNRLAVIALITAFFLAGLFRVSCTVQDRPRLPDNTAGDYSGIVVESSPTTKIIKIDRPASLSGTKAIIRSERQAGIGDSIVTVGTLKELVPAFKNPASVSWKWLKVKEGVLYEIRGTVISVHASAGILERIRRYCSEKIDRSGAAHADVIKALTIGDTTSLGNATKDLFLKTGTSHILSISGSHLAVIVSVMFFICTSFMRINSRLRENGMDRRYAAVITIPFTIAFMLISGSSPPTVRATIMIIIYMLAIVFERHRHVVNGLFLSALVILVLYPFSLFSPSFQLTFISVLFIVLVDRRYGKNLARLSRPFHWLLSMVLITLSATAGTLPVVLYHFYGFNPLSIIHNLIAVPLLCIVATPLSLAGIVMPYGNHILHVSGIIIGFTVRVLEGMNWGYIYPVIRPSLYETIIYLIAAISFLHLRTKTVRIVFFTIIIPVALVMAGIAGYNRFANENLCMNFLDVGLGDAMLVEAPHGIRLLIDGGGLYGSDFDMGRSVIGPFLLAKKIRTLDYVVNTHPHQDHIAGLEHVLQYFDVRAFTSGVAGIGAGNVRNILNEQKIPVFTVHTGDRLKMGDRFYVDVLRSPARVDRDINNSSLVLKATYGEQSFLLTADIGEETERSLIMHDIDLRSSVLKIAHHGSRFSSTAGFVQAVRPQLSVLSVGPGIKGIPSGDTIARFEALNVPVYRTDRHGCVRVCTDGKKLTVHTEAP